MADFQGIKVKLNEQSKNNTLNDFNKLVSDMKKQANDNPISFKVDNINKGFEKIKNDIGETNNCIKSIGSNASSLTGFFVRWLSVSQSIMFSIRQIGEGISFINSVNKQSTNIRMVTGMSEEEMNSYVKSVNNMAIRLKDDTNSLLDSSEVFLRAGRNLQEASKMTELSTMVSKVSGQTQATTGNQMIQIQNGWKLSTESMMGYMDKLSVLDQKSSSSLAEISTALGRTSASASESGVKFEDLATWITTVSDVSKKSASTIGESFRSIFARMTNLKLGKIGEEGEAISDVEKALNRVKIPLRDSETSFRNMGDVIKEVMSKWSGWNDIEKNSVANAIASARQKENFILLMNNQGKIQEYLNYQAESAGSIQKQYNTYLDSTEAKMQGLKAESQKFWLQILDSNTIKGAITGLTQIVQALQWMTSNGKLLGITLVALTAEFIALTKGVELFGLAFKALQSFSIISMLANPLFLVGTAIAGAVVAIGAFSRANQKAKEDIEATKKATDDLSQAMKNMDKGGMESGIKALSEKENKLKDIVNQIKSLKVDLENKATEAIQKKYGGGDVEGQILGQINTLEYSLKKEIKVLEDEGLAVDKNTYSLVQLSEARQRVSEINRVEQIKKETEEQWNNRKSVESLFNEYNNLSSAENQSVDVKARLSQVSENLKDKVKGLITVTDEDGVVRIKNVGLVENQIKAFSNENLTLEGLTQIRLTDYKNHLVSEKLKSEVTYAEVKRRIELYGKEYSAAMDKINPRMELLGNKYKAGSLTDQAEIDEYNNLVKGAMYTSTMFSNAIAKNANVIKEIDDIMKAGGVKEPVLDNIIKNPPTIKDDGKKEKKEKEAKKVEDLKILIDFNKKYKDSLELVGIEIEKNDKKIGQTDKLQEKIRLEKNSLDLLKQRSQLTDEAFQNNVKAEKSSRELLEDFGFTFDKNNVITNMDLLLKKQDEANKLLGDSKKLKIEETKNLEIEIGKHTSINSEMAKNRSMWLDTNAESIKHNKNLEEIAKTIRENVSKEFDDTMEKIIFSGKTEKEAERYNKNIVDSIQNEINLLNEKNKLEKESLEYTKKREELDSLSSKLDVIKKDKLADINREKAKELGLISEREKALEYQEEKSQLEKKLNILNNNSLKDMTKEQVKLLGFEDERERALERQLDLQQKQKEFDEDRNKSIEEYNKKISELNEKQKNLMNQKNIMTFGKTKEGTFDMFYNVDQESLNEVNKDIQETTDDFNKSMQEKKTKFDEDLLNSQKNYDKEINKLKEKLNDDLIKKEKDYQKWLFELKDSTNDALKAKQKDFDLWEEENTFNNQIKSLEMQKTHAEDSFNVQKELWDNIKNLSESELKSGVSDNLYGIINDGFNNLSLSTKEKFDGVLQGIRQSISDNKSKLDSLMNDMNNLPMPDFSNNSEMGGNWADESEYGRVNKYEGRQIAKFDDGGFTGNWGSEGKLAILHEKEWTANKIDTNNLLKATETLKNISIPDVMNNMVNRMIPSFKMPDMIATKARDTVNTFQFNNAQFKVDGIKGEFEAERFFKTLTSQAFTFSNRDQ